MKKDYRRSEEAGRDVSLQLRDSIKLLKEKGIREEEIAVGFLDEASP